MVIGFKNQFVEPILLGIKVHTIRSDEKGRWKPGMLMHMATGTRTKKYNCFKEAECVSTQDIEVKYIYKGKVKRNVVVKIDGIAIDYDTFFKLVSHDGFASGLEFYQWFNEDFKGKIIHWTDLKY